MFTEKQIKALPLKNNPYKLWESSKDPALKGFGIQVARGGTKSFVLYFSSPETGKRRMMTFGKYPVLTLKSAREKARNARAVIDQGIDPIEEENRQEEALRAKEQADANRGTVEMLFKCYIQDLELDGKRSVIQVKSIYDRDIKKKIGNMPASEVTEEHIADIVTAIADRGAITLANRTRTYLRAAFSFGRQCRSMPRWRGKTPDFNLRHNPASETKRAGKEQPGQRALIWEEVRILWKSIGTDAMSVELALALKFLLATGQRVEEVLHARWTEFDIDEKLWAIPGDRRKTKNRTAEPHIVPLTDFHLGLLAEVKKYSNGEYLFPDNNGEQPRNSGALSQAVGRFCCPQGNSKRTPFTRFSPRDIRRTWKTLAGSIGLNLEIRNRIQGHAFQDVGSRHYDRWDYLEEKRVAMDAWVQRLEKTISNDLSAKVIPEGHSNVVYPHANR